ncbi:splicing factor 3B subunit 5/RDS3 complex subunit 10 [Nadsonia fulvescens var. elongata DSM 6958]|uniref:Splicing factor 3B subunit 5/RDS3 complex subunit 10 n=1 Tax=Nadsonia fulvescens var. elongata DSM 6958 TaxID=857566 RepID=A0A1E3PKA4_9ASCO|nr:splicing factor 3B subunit 5/RDS3 complex subunit 10 [Nadsonia fulvescens var. elongata DSM 6958]
MRLRAGQQFEQQQSRFIGVGNVNTTKQEWQSNVHRDTYASLIGHPATLEQLAISLGLSQEELKLQFINKMIQPCGPVTKDG